jgi:hypothetical protein
MIKNWLPLQGILRNLVLNVELNWRGINQMLNFAV